MEIGSKWSASFREENCVARAGFCLKGGDESYEVAMREWRRRFREKAIAIQSGESRIVAECVGSDKVVRARDENKDGGVKDEGVEKVKNSNDANDQVLQTDQRTLVRDELPQACFETRPDG